MREGVSGNCEATVLVETSSVGCWKDRREAVMPGLGGPPGPRLDGWQLHDGCGSSCVLCCVSLLCSWAPGSVVV